MDWHIRGRLALFLAALAALAGATACGDDDAGGGGLPDGGEYVAPAGDPLTLDSSRACALDGDCDEGMLCFQGVCAMGASAVEVVPGLAVVEEPPRIQRVTAGQALVTVEIGLSSDVPAAGLDYRVERSDEPGAVPEVMTAEGSGSHVTIDVPSGLADPDREGSDDPVYVNLVTAAGTVRLILAPDFPHDGGYAGEVVMGTFGQLGLPIDMKVVTSPANTTLEDADEAYLVLPIEEGNLWNPMPPTDGGPTHVTRALEYDAFVDAWVARFELPYDPEAGSAFGWVTEGVGNAPSRNLRLEIQPAGGGELVGNVSDRWRGLFETRSVGGARQSEDVLFEGTFRVRRVEAAPALEDVTPPVDYTVGAVTALPDPVVDACGGVSFGVSADVGGVTRDCAGITDVAGFEGAAADAQAGCALAVAATALSADTTASQIVAFLDDSIPDPGGRSFSEFMQDCVTQTDGTCVPSAEVVCARQLVATATRATAPGDADFPLLLDAYQDTTREAFLGKQFAAFHADAQTRLDWLSASDYPAVVTSAVQSFIAGLLDDWQEGVLDVHLEVLRGQLDPSGGTVLGQELTGLPDALDRQRQLLLEITQGWRGAADAVALGASRWSTLLTNPSDRDAKATYVYDRTLELYLMAGVLAELNRQAGAGANNAVFAGGFRALLSDVSRLAQPFDQLIYERQGEVVVSTSLDPTAGNETILADLQSEAMDEVASADDALDEVISRAHAELLQEAELTARIGNEASELEDQLVDLCGLPEGCTEPDTGACAPRVAAGECGFVLDSSGEVLDAAPDDANPSEAGAAILEVQSALLELRRAEEAVRVHAAQTDLYFETTQAFAGQVERWNTERQSLVTAIDDQITQLQASSNDSITSLADNLSAQMERRQERIAEQQAMVDQWQTIVVDGVEDDAESRVEIAAYRATAAGLNLLADEVNKKAKAVKEGLPRSTGMSNDTSFMARMAVLMKAFWVTKAIRVGATAATAQADRLSRELTRVQQLREAELHQLELTDGVRATTAEADVEMLRNEFDLVANATAQEQRIVEQIIENMDRDVEAALAYERDLVELRDRRDEVHARLVEDDELHIQVEQAELTVEQAMLQYARVTQRAQLIQGRLATVRTQLENVNQLLGSPSVVFAWANRLTLAEGRLERAKAALMDWVVALEYFAVRPFFDSRIQIMLARNTTQLEAIAEDLQRIQDSCGGAVNRQVVDVSVRDDLLDITRDMTDFTTGEAVSPAERFRSLLEVGRIPVDKRVRYRSDATVGTLLNRGDVLAVSFDLGLNEFANLENACNAKIERIAIQLQGEDLGTALPTVSLLYDGTSRLRSCQPDIQSIVETLGPDATPFDEITEFRTPGRSMSPVAGINEFPETGNETLGGLPLSSQYTLLIDPEAGENADIDWSNLDDVRLRIEYTYQDLFPAGRCQ